MAPRSRAGADRLVKKRDRTKEADARRADPDLSYFGDALRGMLGLEHLYTALPDARACFMTPYGDEIAGWFDDDELTRRRSGTSDT